MRWVIGVICTVGCFSSGVPLVAATSDRSAIEDDRAAGRGAPTTWSVGDRVGFTPAASAGQSEFQVEDRGESAPLRPVAGPSLIGPSGFVTVPTPVASAPWRYRVGCAVGAPVTSSFELGPTRISSRVREDWRHLVARLPGQSEVAITQLHARREHTPALPELDGEDTVTGLGIAMGSDADGTPFVVGAHYTPLTARQAARLNLEQLTLLRTIYGTMGVVVTPRLSSYLHARTCYLPVQTWVMPSGETRSESRKNLLVTGLALEWRPGATDRGSLFGELLHLNHRDLLVRKNLRWQAHLGLRWAVAAASVEVVARSLGNEPNLLAGISIGY